MLAGPTIRRRRLGTDLRRLREQSSLRLEEVAQHLGVAPSTLSRIETGKAPTRTSYLTVMLDLYGVDDPERRRLFMDSAREGQRKGWWAGSAELLLAGTGTYLGLEAEASALHTFQAQVVPDLVRTPAYARAVVTASRPELAPDQVDTVVAVQLRRQEVLQRSDPIRLRLILDESVLLRSLGPVSLMREQLERLIDAGSQPMVTIQVLRLAGAGPPVLAGSFGILSFAGPDDDDVAYAEGIRGHVLLEQRESELHAMRLMFDALSRSASSPRESARLIRELAASL